MIIRFANDSREGACTYLEQGTGGDRGKKDIRVQLSNLDCNQTIGAVNKLLKQVGKWDRYEDNYKHIILSFNGDDLTKSQMQEIVEDFLNLYMHPYTKDEYIYYAEAHIPKIKKNKNGEERRPHIHIFIHKYSPILNRRLKFDTHPRRKQELNLIKNYLIKKHNLNYTFTNKIISKSKLDIYNNNKLKSKRELKKMIEEYILSNLQNYSSFESMINDIKRTFGNKIENIKFSKNAKTPYISIKFRGFDRAIRFKGLLFSQETFQEARNSYLSGIELKKYDPAYKLTLEEMLAEMRKRQEYLNKEIQERFKTARKRKENLGENKEFLLFKQLQKNNTNVNIKQINKIMFKIKLMQDYLQLAQSLALVPYLEDIGIINKDNSIKLINKSKNINMDIMINGNNVNILTRGGMEEEAKISAVIVADKIRKGELKKEDLIVDGTKEYKEMFFKELDKQLGERDKQVKREKQVKSKETIGLTI